jgi:hypothetical protein
LPDVPSGLAARTLSALPPAASKVAAATRSPSLLPTIQGALERAKLVETLLPASGTTKGS